MLFYFDETHEITYNSKRVVIQRKYKQSNENVNEADEPRDMCGKDIPLSLQTVSM